MAGSKKERSLAVFSEVGGDADHVEYVDFVVSVYVAVPVPSGI